MTVPDDLDPVLWQQAVEAAMKGIDWDLMIDRDVPAFVSGILTAAVPVLQQATTRQAPGSMQYLTAYDCDGTVAAHWKRPPTQPRVDHSWEPATADEVAAAAYRCPYCGSVYDGSAQCYLHDGCVDAGPAGVARGETL